MHSYIESTLTFMAEGTNLNAFFDQGESDEVRPLSINFLLLIVSNFNF